MAYARYRPRAARRERLQRQFKVTRLYTIWYYLYKVLGAFRMKRLARWVFRVRKKRCDVYVNGRHQGMEWIEPADLHILVKLKPKPEA